MDDMYKLAVGFSYGGEFFFDGNRMHYLGGSEKHVLHRAGFDFVM